MEKLQCKICFKRFSNGQALGGHMRSHVANLPVRTIREETDATSSTSLDDKENPKKSVRLVDHDFNVGTIDAAGSVSDSVVVQDIGSETESSKNLTRRKSKRVRSSAVTDHRIENESEPVSSISDATTEEDVAFGLMMLSRDKWFQFEQESEKSMEEETDEFYEEIKSSSKTKRGKYKCDTCRKVFQSYQALGGHRASHKKIKLATNPIQQSESNSQNAGNSSLVKHKIHRCPVCYRVFASGQALGGHKRSHLTGSSPAPAINWIDLNLPAPMDGDDEISQIYESHEMVISH